MADAPRSEIAGGKPHAAGEPLTAQDADDPWGAEPDDRWVMVRAEILGSGLCHADGALDSPEGLPPIPVRLVERLEAWARWHDELDAANTSFPDPFYWEQRSDAPLAAFNKEGRAIARALKAALPSDWTVVYEDIERWLHKDRPTAGFRLVLPAGSD